MKRSILIFLFLISMFFVACNNPTKISQDAETDTHADETTETVQEETEESTLILPIEYANISADDGYFEIAYKTESYAKIGESVDLISTFILNNGEVANCVFASMDKNIAACTANGTVTGISEGLSTIRAYINEQLYFDFYVTVLPDTISDALMLAIKANNSNIFTRLNLGIGAGTPVYYRDIFGSISKILYNDALVIDRTYEKIGTENTVHTDGLRSKHHFDLEYITVHYTGNMNVNATAKNNAEYFAYTKEVSVHYVTGNDGVYCCLDDRYISWNAGDRAAGQGGLTWKASGVYVKEGEEEKTPTFSVSENKKFTINGEESTVSIPRRTGTIIYHGDTFEYRGNTYPTINKMGIPWKIVDGQYYLGKTWWSFRASEAGCICGIGGDYNSISIESAVNPETDLWYTWQKTAQLVAKLLNDNNLDTTRVTGHHMWTQKDCPQPLLENDLEIWDEFMEMVRYEYALLHTFSDCQYSMKLVQGSEICTDEGKRAKLVYNGKRYIYTQNPGRIIPDDNPHIILYTVTVQSPNGSESITLATAVSGSGN